MGELLPLGIGDLSIGAGDIFRDVGIATEMGAERLAFDELEQGLFNVPSTQFGNEILPSVDIPEELGSLRDNNLLSIEQINQYQAGLDNFPQELNSQLESEFGELDDEFQDAVGRPDPDELDDEPRIFILIVRSDYWGGYFDPAQQMADSVVYNLWSKHSSEREIIYIEIDMFNFNELELHVLAHEFGHMVHWGQDHSPEPPEKPIKYWEDGWIDEAFATFAEVFLLEDINIPDVMDDAFFASKPDLPLIYFIGGENYNQVKLWMTFMYEHYGKQDFTSTLIQDQANGITGVRNTLRNLGYTETFEETFEHWVLANYLDDEEYQNGKYSYYHYNFTSCRLTDDHNTYPTGLNTYSVSSFAVDYIAFNTSAHTPITIDFTGDSSSVFRLSFILYDTQKAAVKDVQSIQLDSLNRGLFNVVDFGETFNKIIMVVMNVDSSLGDTVSAEYTYLANIETTIFENQRDLLTNKSLFSYSLKQNYPNPFNPATKIHFNLPEPDHVTLNVYNLSGQLIEVLVNEHRKSGEYEVIWTAEGLPSGIYFYRLQVGDYSETRKLILQK